MECHPRLCTLPHGGGCVCLVRPGSVNPGSEHEARESKGHFAEKCSAGYCCLPEPRLLVGETRIQRKTLCLGISPAKAQHSLGYQSWAWGCCCCLPELLSASRWKMPAWNEILFAVASLLPEREAWSQTSVTALPRSKCGEGAARRPRGREGTVGLVSGKTRESG